MSTWQSCLPATSRQPFVNSWICMSSRVGTSCNVYLCQAACLQLASHHQVLLHQLTKTHLQPLPDSRVLYQSACAAQVRAWRYLSTLPLHIANCKHGLSHASLSCSLCHLQGHPVATSSASYRVSHADQSDLICQHEVVLGDATYLVVPPSKHPSSRRDAIATQALLAELIQTPSQAFSM